MKSYPSRYSRYASITCIAAAVTLLGVAAPHVLAQDSDSNGISVGRPKLFDNRTLQIMLDGLNDRLKAVRIVDDEKLQSALENRQGSEVSDLRRSVSLTSPAIPLVSITETPDEDGALTPSERTTTQAAVSPAAPNLAELIAAPAYAPSFGSSAEDLLSDQVNLTYQIFNLRMLLERSLTDRVWNGEPRLQAVLGFQVTLDPLARHRDHAAFVEVTVNGPGSGEPVSLVAMMPFEKTYNSSALSTKSNDFGGSAVAKVLTLGYRQSRRQQTFYLFRDADTLAQEHLGDPAASSSTFGWTFRPVLGRRSVTPGVRQMFAVIAMPAQDVDTSEVDLEIRVRTHWRKYKRSTLTTKAKERDRRDWPGAMSLKIYSSARIESVLQPEIHKVDWSTTGSDTAVVTVRGKNFFPGTRVFLGDAVHDDPTDGLVLKSDQTLELKTTVRALAFGDAVLSGRYGPAARFERSHSGDVACAETRSGILINSFSWTPEAGRKLIPFELVLQARDGDDLDLCPDERPLFSIGGTYIPGPYKMRRLSCGAVQPIGAPIPRFCWQITAWVAQDLLVGEAVVQARFPFRGPSWTDRQFGYAENRTFKVVRIGGDGPVRLAIEGARFSDDWTVEIDQRYDATTSPALTVVPFESGGDEGTLLLLDVDKCVLDRYKKLILKAPGSAPAVLDIPPAKPKPAKPTIDNSKAPTAKKATAPAVAFSGKNLNGIEKAFFSKEELRVKVAAKGTQITVYLSRDVTKNAGPVVLLLQAKDGSLIPADLTIVP